MLSLSKQIFLELRAERKQREEDKLDKTIAKGQGGKTMESALKNAHKQKWITAVASDSGSVLKQDARFGIIAFDGVRTQY